MSRSALWSCLLIIVMSVVACGRVPLDPAAPGVDLSDPEVGGGAGVATGPETPIPTPTMTREPSPRLDVLPTAGGRTPTAEPTAPSTIEATALPPTATIPPPDMPTATASPPTETATATPTATADGERIHVVQAGENLYRIGLQYGLSWVAIAEYNRITDPNAIYAGQELRIPPSPTVTPTAGA